MNATAKANRIAEQIEAAASTLRHPGHQYDARWIARLVRRGNTEAAKATVKRLPGIGSILPKAFWTL